MKRILFFAVALGIALGAGSCKQDLHQDPPFNYPTEEGQAPADGEDQDPGQTQALSDFAPRA